MSEKLQNVCFFTNFEFDHAKNWNNTIFVVLVDITDPEMRRVRKIFELLERN